jgi:hypothetical protein
MERIIANMRTFILLLLSSICYAGSLDLPGSFSAAYDYRLNNPTENSDNRKGRWTVHGEQAISSKALTDYIQGYVGYELYDPNFEASNNYGILGLHNKSLFDPFILSFEFQRPFNQTADQVNRFVVQISYQKDWNLSK